MIMKKYENPMLQVVSIKKNDIITGSDQVSFGVGMLNPSAADAPDRFRDFEDYSY